MGEILDPIGSRDHVRAIKALMSAVVRKDPYDKIGELARKALESFEALDLCPDAEEPLSKLGASLLSTGQAFIRGEGLKRDEQGVLIMGDLGMELADALYAYAEERTKEGN